MTEIEYFTQFRSWCRNPLVDVDATGPAGVPWTLVKRALELRSNADENASRERDENLRYEEVWCVFDFDNHPKVAEARELASANGLRLAMSNPCFELWLILHFRDNPGQQDRRVLQRMLATAMPNARGKHLNFEALIVGYGDAYNRAERMYRDATDVGEKGRNPSTEVFFLTDSIDASGRQKRLKAQQDRGQESRRKAEAAAEAALRQAELELAAATSVYNEEEVLTSSPGEDIGDD